MAAILVRSAALRRWIFRTWTSRMGLPARSQKNDRTIVLHRGVCHPPPDAGYDRDGRRLPGGRMQRYDAIVIGGGLVGSAIAYGLARAGLKTALVDEGDVAFRASRGNFGLVWVQSKGDGAPHYQRWTRQSADEWPLIAEELATKTGISVASSAGRTASLPQRVRVRGEARDD